MVPGLHAGVCIVTNVLILFSAEPQALVMWLDLIKLLACMLGHGTMPLICNVGVHSSGSFGKINLGMLGSSG